MSSAPVKLGIVGLGSWAKVLTRAARSSGKLEIVAGFSRSVEKRQAFQQEFGVAPVEYAQTHRLLLAKRLLTDTDMTVLEVAMASGFASLTRFNDLFRTRYRMTPGELRRTASDAQPADRLAFDLAYRPPYDWEAMLTFLERRAIPHGPGHDREALGAAR